jgi:tetratricopeptide (TPR) repeat protein
MATIAELMEQGLRLHQAGRCPDAVPLYRQVLQADPNHLSAVLLYGTACHALGRWSEAVAAYEQALRAEPDDVEVLTNLAGAYRELGRFDDAVRCCRRALSLQPDFAAAHNNLGNALKAQKKLNEAVVCYQTALSFQPNFAEAQNNLGSALRDQGKFDEAVICYQRALSLKPNQASTHNNLGNALKDLGEFDGAVASYLHALRIKPHYPEALNNLGTAYREQEKLDEAATCLREALDLKPTYAEAHNNLGNVLRGQGNAAAAIECYEQAIRLRPDDAEAHMNLGMTLLLRGDFERGWTEYEWRRRTEGAIEEPSALWDGSPLEGRPILVTTEQGVGDTIQFVRYTPLVRARGGSVWLDCRPELRTLLADCPGIDRLIEPGQPLPDFAAYVPLMSLPGILGTDLNNIPNEVPYLRVDPARQRRWSHELSGLKGSRVGIVWRGNPKQRSDRRRSISLAHLAPLTDVPGVQLVSLQKGSNVESLETFERDSEIVEIGSRLEDFADTAAVLMNLDMLITSDTSVAHLAGALGRPVWLALAFDPDWRWLLGREDCPWYPTMRLYRQSRPGDWDEVFGRIARDLVTMARL